MHWVAEVFANLLADVLPNTDDVAGGSHLHDLAVVRHTVKSGENQQAAFAKQRLDVERHFHIGSIHILVLQKQ